MSTYLVAKKFFENIEENTSTSFIVGKNYSENISQNNQFSVIKKHFKTKFNLEFDSQGGTSHTQKEVILGETYGELPIPTKTQNIFIGWFTDPTSGSQITKDSIVELSITKLYAHWEYAQIDLDCTSYSVTTTSSYRNTGIYTASISDSSQPIYIDWGDGTVEKTTSSISQKSHTYNTTGNFTVRISNNITSFAPSYNNSTWYGTTSQNRYTFNGMLTTGSKVISLPSYAFYYCQKMTDIDFMETCWPSVTTLLNYCFYYCSSLTSIQGAKRFTSFGASCFQYCLGLTGIQDLSEFKFKTLDNSYTFANCTNVTQWILPSVFTGTRFTSYMFANNSSLVGVGKFEKTINQIKVIQIEYLEGNSGKINTKHIPTLNTSIEFEMMPLVYTGNSYIGFTPDAATYDDNADFRFFATRQNDIYFDFSDGRIHEPAADFSLNNWYTVRCYNNGVTINGTTYTGSTVNGYIDPIPIYIFGDTAHNVNFKLKYLKIYENNQLVQDLIPVRKGTIGYMYDKVSGQLFENIGSGNFILGSDKTDAEEIIVEQEIITSKLPESLTSTGTYTFQNCSNLNNIIIPSKVQSIENYAFYGCTSLNNVNVEATNLTAINQYAFYNCNKLADLNLPNTVKTIGNYAFYNCTSLDYAGKQNNELPSQLTSIGSYAYQGCRNLKSLNIQENLQIIGDYAFAGCYQISSIVDKRLSAQTVSTNTFGSATGTSNTAFTGYKTKGSNILSTYFDATGYDENAWDDPLQILDKCGFVRQYIDPENIVSCTVTFDAGIGNISETTRTIIKGKKIGKLPIPTVTEEQTYFGGWSTVANDIDSIIYEDYKVTSDITLYAVYGSQPFVNYEVILNNQWQASSKTNPDASTYDGVYESFSNYNQGSKAAVMYIKIKGYSKFTIYIRSYAESSYDYTVAFNLDIYTPSNPLTSVPSSYTSGVKAHTSGKQNGGTAISSYTKVEYTGIDGNEHYICIAYRKDGSVNSGDDRGYVLIER